MSSSQRNLACVSPGLKQRAGMSSSPSKISLSSNKGAYSPIKGAQSPRKGA